MNLSIFFFFSVLIYFLLVVNSHFHETVEIQGSTRAVFSRRYSPPGAVPGAPPVSSSEAPSTAPSKSPSKAPSVTSSGELSRRVSSATPTVAQRKCCNLF